MKTNLQPILILLLFIFVSVVMAQDAQVPFYEPIEGCFTDITIDLDYECGYVTVPEFYDGRTDGTIRLAVVRIFAVGEGEPDAPIFFMDGGPGGSLLINLGLDQGAITSELELGEDLEASTPIMDMVEAHDFVLFSQRGTQFSEPLLVCEEADDLESGGAIQGLDFESLLEQMRIAMQTCIEAYTTNGVDLSAFTNFANADDVNAVRESLGYEQIIFYGESYGAQLGLHVMQQHPDILEAVILDGVNALTKVEWIQDDGLILEQRINTLLTLCAEDEKCAAKLENPESLLEDAFAHIQEEPIPIAYTAPDGTEYTFDLSPEILVVALEGMFTNSQQRPRIPLALWGLRNGDGSHIAAALVEEATQPPEEAILAGLMHNAMVCSDDPPQAVPSYDQSGYTEFATFTEQVFAQFYVSICELLDLEQLPDTSDEDITLDVPTLVLSGGLDVRTPTVRNQEVADALPNSRIITFEYSDHVQYRGDYAPCAAAIVSTFVNDPTSLADLDESCTTSMPAPEITLPPPTVTDVIGLEFTALGVFENLEFLQIPEGSQFSVTFVDSEQMAIIADCNTVTATYTGGEDQTIDISLGASTRAACPEGSPVDAFLDVLENATIVLLTDVGDNVSLSIRVDDENFVPFTATK